MASIDAQIRGLKAKKRDLAIKRNLGKSSYDTLFFTYEANCNQKVHFAYLADYEGYECFAVLCKEDQWLSSRHDEGHELGIVELLDGEAIFMTWDEAVGALCGECAKYLSLEAVLLNGANVLRAEGDRILKAGKADHRKLHRQARRLEIARETASTT